MPAILTRSKTHVVLIPSYNSGRALASVVRRALATWNPIWVIIDGSTDGSERAIERIASDTRALRLLKLPKNSGKGNAILLGMQEALAEGFTHAVVMDADGQHDPQDITTFMQLSHVHPSAMILGVPIFGSDAPKERVVGRRIGNWWANLETLWGGIGDSLFGFRTYPIAESLAILESTRTARGFDFDTELAVRLYWKGVQPMNVNVRVYYPPRSAGGISHFKYFRDNWTLIQAHTRLVVSMLPRLPQLVKCRPKRVNQRF